MTTKSISLAAFSALMGGTAIADVPNVAVDIAPVHSLVARVMKGVGHPELILPSSASPHGYSMRPSEAQALQDADVVVWMGADLAPWMEGAVETLAEDAAVLTLLEADKTTLLEFRENALFEKHAHGADDDHEDHHLEHFEDHDDDHHKAHDEHAHVHSQHDPHAWLSPANAATWLDLIAAELASKDPEHAEAYLANAAAGRDELAVLTAEVSASLAPVRGGSFIVFHDAFQYFETDFGFPASGAISLGDAEDPSPARLSQIKKRVQNEGVDCVLAEPQFNPGLVAAVTEGTEVQTGVIDPLGANLEPGAALYPQLIRNIASTLTDCM